MSLASTDAKAPLDAKASPDAKVSPDAMQPQGRLAVYDEPRGPFTVRLFPLRAVAPGEILAKVRMSTICRSDIHSWLGHRPNPCPGVLGHEIVGTIVELGAGVTHDMRGDALAQGDRITWSEYFVRDADQVDLEVPQKSPSLAKYGHLAAATPPHHHGGFGEYCYLLPKTWVLKVPAALSDEEAAPVNCGVATMVCATERARIGLGDRVVIQGLGLLGLYGAALAKARGASEVVGIDPDASRRERGLRFGCDHVLDPTSTIDDDLVVVVRALCGGRGADAVIEVCGVPSVVATGLRMLGHGGRFVLAGMVNPNAGATIDLGLVLRGLLTIEGVHNYHPRHLCEALDFVARWKSRFPFHELVDGHYALDDVERAMRDADERRVVRAAVVPWSQRRA